MRSRPPWPRRLALSPPRAISCFDPLPRSLTDAPCRPPRPTLLRTTLADAFEGWRREEAAGHQSQRPDSDAVRKTRPIHWLRRSQLREGQAKRLVPSEATFDENWPLGGDERQCTIRAPGELERCLRGAQSRILSGRTGCFTCLMEQVR